MDGPLPMDPGNVSNGQLYMLIEKLHQQLANQQERSAAQHATFSKRIEDLTGEVAMARRETAEMVDLWKSGKTIVSVFKIAGGIAAAALALWGLISLVKGIPTVRTG